MPADEFRRVGHELIERIAEFYETLPARDLRGARTPAAAQELLGPRALPDQATDAGTLLNELAPLLFDESLHNGHPRFFGYITSSAAPIGALADLLAAAANPNLAKWELAPFASEVEAQAVRWIAELIGYDPDSAGLMVSGGNMANFLAFVAARAAKAPWAIRETGNAGGDRLLTAYVSSETHTWIEKAVDVCGLGAGAVRWIETGADGRMRLDRLREHIAADRNKGRLPFFVVGTAGSVATGAIDPLRELAAICRDEDLWFHVDGAYGAPAACLPEAPPDLHALDLADSVAIDPHKWLYSPIEAACVLTRHENALRNAFSFRPSYYSFDDAHESGADYYELGMQNTRGFRALKVWLGLRQAGRKGYQESIRGDIGMAAALYASATAHAEFEAHGINLSIATFRYVPSDIDASNPDATEYLNELNRALLKELKSGGELFLSNAVVDGKYLLRACVVNFRTQQADVDAVLPIVESAGRRLDQALRRDSIR